MSSLPLVSFVCVTRNRPEFLPSAVRQFENQRWRNKELVVVDDSDAHECLLFPRTCTVVRLDPDARWTIAAKRNLGVTVARGRYVTWLDDDDWYHPEKATRAVDALENSECSVFGPRTAYWLTGDARVFELTVNEQIPISGGSTFRRECLQVAAFDESCRSAADTRWLRALASALGPRWFLPADGDDHLVAISHGRNVSNPAPPGRPRMDLSMRGLDERFGLQGDVGVSAHFARLEAAGCFSTRRL